MRDKKISLHQARLAEWFVETDVPIHSTVNWESRLTLSKEPLIKRAKGGSWYCAKFAGAYLNWANSYTRNKITFLLLNSLAIVLIMELIEPRSTWIVEFCVFVAVFLIFWKAEPKSFPRRLRAISEDYGALGLRLCDLAEYANEQAPKELLIELNQLFAQIRELDQKSPVPAAKYFKPLPQ